MYLQHYFVILCYYSHATSIWRVTKMNPHIIPWRPKQVSARTIKRLIVALFCSAERLGVAKGSPRSSHRIKKLIVKYPDRRPESPAFWKDMFAPLCEEGGSQAGYKTRTIASEGGIGGLVSPLFIAKHAAKNTKPQAFPFTKQTSACEGERAAQNPAREGENIAAQIIVHQTFVRETERQMQIVLF